MTESETDLQAGAVRWTCPFCLLLCDNLSVRASASGDSWELVDGECAAAQAGLAQFTVTPSQATPTVDGHPADLPTAIDAAARLLAASRQPLFGGLGTDVAGARALYRLACETGAICDPANGAALMQGVRTLQDRGGFSTTLAEVRNRADVIVCIGGLPGGDFLARCAVGRGEVEQRHVVLVGGSADERAALDSFGERHGVAVEAIDVQGDLFSAAAALAALVAGRQVRAPSPSLAALAKRLWAARYGVIVGDTGRLPAQGALLIECVNRAVATLNTRTRAAALWLGGGNGARSCNEVFTWMSGLPLRSRAGPSGLEHEPLCFDTARLLADKAVDSLLWVSSFDAALAPPAAHTARVPLVVLGHPGLAPSSARAGSVFIPVSTPGIGTVGHLFRADGGAVLPMVPLYRDTLPTLAQVLGPITHAIRSLREQQRAAA